MTSPPCALLSLQSARTSTSGPHLSFSESRSGGNYTWTTSSFSQQQQHRSTCRYWEILTAASTAWQSLTLDTPWASAVFPLLAVRGLLLLASVSLAIICPVADTGLFWLGHGEEIIERKNRQKDDVHGRLGFAETRRNTNAVEWPPSQPEQGRWYRQWGNMK